MSHLLVAAIDFGTTFSGYAFSTVFDFKGDPLKISANTWTAGSGNLMSQKTSTCVLFDPDGKFHSFGYEAEDKYSNLALDDEHYDWYYFRRFKMMLYNKLDLNREVILEDDKGKQMTAMKVFSSAIGYLKNHLMKACKDQLTDVSDTDIRWVLTVPAIWDDPAKQFMREAAEKAGIIGDHLMIALEPEAASLFCKHIPVQRDSSNSTYGVFEAGSKYMVVDAGGGTIDITVHEVQQDKSLKELYKANGGDWGGTKVDAAFQELLADIVGNDVMEAFSTDHKSDLLDLLRDFEVKKRTITPELKDKVTFKVPINLLETFREIDPGNNIKSVVSSKQKYKNKLTWTGDKLRMEADLTKVLYDESCKKIVEHLKTLFRNPSVRGVSAILLVGGFSESPMLRAEITRKFPELKIIVPQDAGLAVLKGAVIFGHDPETIRYRVCKYTYGIDTTLNFDPSKHPLAKKIILNDTELCDDVFDIHVKVGQTIEVGKTQVKEQYRVTHPNQTRMPFKIYSSYEEEPKFVTDSSCRLLGKFEIRVPDTSKGLDRVVETQMTFSGTEIKVTATDPNTNHSVSTTVNFLG